jgi:DNA-binding response OmpR family regulator
MIPSLILLVEDEPALAEIVKESLQSRGFAVCYAATAAAALKDFFALKPALVVLDIMLPDGDGFEIAQKIRATDAITPILFLTARSAAEDVVLGFETGGNDYLRKPFSLAELVVRIQSLLKVGRIAVEDERLQQKVYVIGSFQFHYPSGLLQHPGHQRTLTAREAEILHLLLLHKIQMIDRKLLLMKCWGNDDYFSGRSLDVFISKLRRYLKDDASIVIINVRGKGYKLVY